MGLIIFLLGMFFIYHAFEPKVDYNPHTGQYLLWYNTTEGRSFIPIWNKKIDEEENN